MIEKITDQNLERYDFRLKEWCDRKFFEKGNYGKYQTTEEARAVAFYPAPNTPLEGKVKFSFKETMPASGDKSPENPSTISGVSEVKVTRCGKNIIRTPFASNSFSENGIQFTVDNNNGTITANGTASSLARIYFVVGSSNLILHAGEKYRFSGCPSGGSDSTYSLRASTVKLNGIDYLSTLTSDFGNGTTWSITKDCFLVASIYIQSGTVIDHLVFKPQLEAGEIETSFEPYSGTDYTLSLGSTYYGGEIDLATGLMTVTWESDVFTSIYSYAETLSNTVKVLFHTTKRNLGGFGASYNTCNKIPTITDSSDMEHIRTSGSNGSFDVALWLNKSRLDISSAANPSSPTSTEWADAVNAWLADNPLLFAYKLATPFTVQFTTPQIRSLIQPDKYVPRLNTVYTDADSIQISYLKSPIRDEYEKTQAILSLGGNS